MDRIMKRGFSAVGLYKPKTKANVGAVLRAADIYGVSMVAVEGARNDAMNAGTNVTKAQRRIPTFMPDDLLDVRPFDCQLVVVDLIPGAVPLPEFEHPDRAMYIFGPEDGTLGHRYTSKAKHVVYVPGNTCMNLSAAVNVILYDRMVKRNEWQGSSGVERHTENVDVAGSIPALATTNI